MAYLFCNVGWMECYRGRNDNDKIVGGGSYVEREGHGFEVCNFAPYENQIYGYVQPSSGRLGENIKSGTDEYFSRSTIDIDRLGAANNDDFITNVSVIWTATHPESGKGRVIIGWYKHATVYREYQKFDIVPLFHKANHITGYRIVAEESNCKLLPIERRTFQIPTRVKGGMGQSNVWYADQSRGEKTIKDLLNKYPSLLTLSSSLSVPSDEPVYPDEIDPQEPLVEGARRRVTVNIYERNSKARGECLKEHGYRCAVCEMSFEDYYGDIGREFIHVHHIKELSSIRRKYEIDPVKHLRPVCPNCHAMLHKKKPAFSVDELRQRLKKKMKDNNASV